MVPARAGGGRALPALLHTARWKGLHGAGDPGEPPTNWQCVFGGSAWEWEPRLGKWYLHMHDSSQPDVDWTNPDVRDEMAGVVRFWKERGVTGFRFDVINLISKPEVIEDVPGDGSACRALVADGPHVHEYLKELVERSGIDGMATVGEMASTGLENCIRYTNPDEHELGMSFSFHHLKVDYKDGSKWKLMDPDHRPATPRAERVAGGRCRRAAAATPVLVQPRPAARHHPLWRHRP